MLGAARRPDGTAARHPARTTTPPWERDRMRAPKHPHRLTEPTTRGRNHRHPEAPHHPAQTSKPTPPITDTIAHGIIVTPASMMNEPYAVTLCASQNW